MLWYWTFKWTQLHIKHFVIAGVSKLLCSQLCLNMFYWFLSDIEDHVRRPSWHPSKIQTVWHGRPLGQSWCFWRNLNQNIPNTPDSWVATGMECPINVLVYTCSITKLRGSIGLPNIAIVTLGSSRRRHSFPLDIIFLEETNLPAFRYIQYP